MREWRDAQMIASVRECINLLPIYPSAHPHIQTLIVYLDINVDNIPNA